MLRKRVVWFYLAAIVMVALAHAPQFASAKGGPKGPVAKGSPKGAVKVMLAPRADNPDQDSSGWAVLNTTCEGIVKANVHIEGATPGDTHAVILVVEGEWDEDSTLTIGDNGKGVGSDEEMVPEEMYDVDGVPVPPGTVTVKLVVRPEGAGGTTGWASAVVELPLKVLE